MGDAAGHIDPLTGEGIHTAMMGGKGAAEVLLQLRAAGNFKKENTRLFERKWMQLFGYDFKLVSGWLVKFTEGFGQLKQGEHEFV